MIEYKSLDFLGFPNYRVDVLGNVWSKSFKKLNEKQIQDIKLEYNIKGITQNELANKYNIEPKLIWKILNNKKELVWKQLKSEVTKDDYLRVKLHGQLSKKYLIHHLILFAFRGNRKSGTECRHLDGNPNNNLLSNLMWGTKAENEIDKKFHKKNLLEAQKKIGDI